MAEYIRRDTLIKRFFEKVDMSERIVDGRIAERFSTFEKLMDVVMDMPTADVAPVRHGRWIVRQAPHAMGGISAKCSVCSKSVQYLGNPLNYCPNCGAKM